MNLDVALWGVFQFALSPFSNMSLWRNINDLENLGDMCVSFSSPQPHSFTETFSFPPAAQRSAVASEAAHWDWQKDQ